MTRRATVAAVAGAAALVGALAGGASDASHAAQQQQQTRPNVLLIETDDQTVESLRVMQNVQRLLAAQGTTFVNSFASFALCCPSRATAITGQYAHTNGVLGNRLPEGGYYKLDNTNTLPVWLQRAGYYTAHIGKYLNEYGTRNPNEVPPGWTEWHGSVDPSTYRFYDYTLNEGGKLVNYGERPQDYQADVYAAKAVDLVRRRAPQAQPFFLWLAFLAPHSGGPREPDDPRTGGARRGAGLATPVPAPRHRNRFASEPLPQSPAFNEADVSDKPVAIRNRRVLPPAQIAAIRENYQQRLESLLAVDEAVGRLVAELERLDELERTLIVFTSDNGFFHGEHRVPAGKVLLYEPSIRVPLIVRGLGFPRGRRLAQPVANIDLAPTIVDVAEARAGRRMDGRSLVPLLRDPGLSWGRDILIENGPGAGNFAAVRSPRYLYAEYASGDRELYDLAADPYELTSRHGDRALARLRGDLARRVALLRRCAGDACRRGPRLAATFRTDGRGCVASRFGAALGGTDAWLLTRVEFFVGGKRRAADMRRPFAASLPRRLLLAPRFRTKLRLRAFLRDGRVVTYDRLLRACG